MKRINNLDKKIKNIEKTMPSIKEIITHDYKSENNIIKIDVNLEDVDIFNKMSMGKQRELNPEIYEYIDNKIYNIPVRYDLNICFFNANITEKEQNEVEYILKKHYALIIHDKNLDLKLNTLKVLSLTFFGIIVLLFYFYINTLLDVFIFIEILSIAGTFALWEATDFYILERNSIKIEKRNAGQTFLTNITFQ